MFSIIFICMIGLTLGGQTNNVTPIPIGEKTEEIANPEDNIDSYEDEVPVSSPKPTVVPTGIEKEAITSMANALISFDRVFEQCAPWTNFHQELQQFSHKKHAFTSQSGQIAGEIIGSLLSIDTQYFQATQSIYRWCSETPPLLEGYRTLFSTNNEDSIDGQRELLLEVLKTDAEQSTVALRRLKRMHSTLNKAANKLDSLVLQLHDDFAEGSENYKNEIKAAELSASNNMTKFQVIKRTIKLSLDKLGKLVPEIGMAQNLINPLLNSDNSTNTGSSSSAAATLRAEFAEIYNFCKNLWTKVNEQAKIDFGQIENELRSKIQAVEKSKTQIENTDFGNQRQIMAIKSAVKSLKSRCRRFRSKYGKVNE